MIGSVLQVQIDEPLFAFAKNVVVPIQLSFDSACSDVERPPLDGIQIAGPTSSVVSQEGLPQKK